MAYVLWSGDPFAGVVVCGSVGLIAWLLIAALVGSVLGILRDLDAYLHQSPRLPSPPPRPRPFFRPAVSPVAQQSSEGETVAHAV